MIIQLNFSVLTGIFNARICAKFVKNCFMVTDASLLILLVLRRSAGISRLITFSVRYWALVCETLR